MIAIIDYGAGNLGSVSKALDFIGAENKITDDVDEILNADKIIVPGVGNFGDIMQALQKKGLVEPLKKAISDGKPYLGICLGLQVLFEESEESSEKGLGILKGKVVKFKHDLKIPQIGWNQIKKQKESKLLEGVSEPYVYFVHSYYVVPDNEEIVLTTTDYGTEFVSGVEKDNIFAVQFHPEKSGDEGIEILRNFVEKC